MTRPGTVLRRAGTGAHAQVVNARLAGRKAAVTPARGYVPRRPDVPERICFRVRAVQVQLVWTAGTLLVNYLHGHTVDVPI